MSEGSKSSVKVAVVQTSSVILDKKGTIEKMAKICMEAGCHGAGAELIVFPEAFVSWYPRGTNFDIVIGSRTPEGRELFKRCVKLKTLKYLHYAKLKCRNSLYLKIF
jgi:predicted amidohydrolase